LTVELTDSRVLFTALVAVVAGMRLVELAISRRNIARLRACGAVEEGSSHYSWMVAVHTAFLIACPLEVWLMKRPLAPALAAAMLFVLVAAAALRYWVIATLGERWSTRIVLVPGQTLAATGPYRWLRHPNYLAVAAEFAALPLVHSAWLSAIIFSVANAAVLWCRVASEEAALARHAGPPRDPAELPRVVEGSR
jgi:methyltransferase